MITINIPHAVCSGGGEHRKSIIFHQDQKRMLKTWTWQFIDLSSDIRNSIPKCYCKIGKIHDPIPAVKKNLLSTQASVDPQIGWHMLMAPGHRSLLSSRQAQRQNGPWRIQATYLGASLFGKKLENGNRKPDGKFKHPEDKKLKKLT